MISIENYSLVMFHKKILKIYNLLESKTGHYFIGTIILINSIILGAQTFQNIPIHIAEYLHHSDKIILGIFITEMIIKLLAGGRSFFHNRWNIFDLIIIFGSSIHHHDFLPLLRGFRVMHLVTMIEAATKIRHILSGFWKAIPGAMSVLGLLLLFFYIYSVIGVFIFRDLGIPQFQHIGVSMETMFQILTGDNWSDIMYLVEKVSRHAWIYFITYYIVMVFVILNLFIGVVVGALQAAEEEIFQKEKDTDTNKEQLILLNNMKNQLDRLEKKLKQK